MIGRTGHARLLGQLLQLQLRGGPLRVEAGEQDLLLQPLAETQRELAGGGGLAGALQPDQQDRHRRGGVEVDRDGAGTAQLLDHHVVDDFDDLLAGGDGLQDLDADGAVADLGDEVAHHGQGDVGVQQREADFPQRFGDVHLVQRAAAAQAVEHAVQLVGQSLEHVQTLLGMRRTAQNEDAPLREPSRSGVAPASGGDRVTGKARMGGVMRAGRGRRQAARSGGRSQGVCMHGRWLRVLRTPTSTARKYAMMGLRPSGALT